MTTMNQDQLRAIFHYLKVPARAYDLGNNTRLDACATIEHTSQGWEVYGIERNSKYDIEVFSNETDACYNLLYRMTSQAAHFYDNEILGYQAQSYRGKSSKKEWWYVAASKNCPDTGRRGPSTISLKNLC